jgi:septal ring factor EnvC (AmiA/AmiB activator)
MSDWKDAEIQRLEALLRSAESERDAVKTELSQVKHELMTLRRQVRASSFTSNVVNKHG